MRPTAQERYGRQTRRSAFLPGVLGAMAVLLGAGLIESESYFLIRYAVAIFALIVAWFAIEARHWWWLPFLAAIAVIWNPAFPFAFGGPWWMAAHYMAALTFILAAALIRRHETHRRPTTSNPSDPE